MTTANTDFGRVADDLRRASVAFAALTSSAHLFGRALSAFRDFERQLVLTTSIAGATREEFRRMEEAARSFALVSQASATEAAGALQQLAQAGFTAEESLAAMSGVLLLSQATLTDIGKTADLVSSNLRAFGLEASETARIANVFTATITGSLATMDKLQFALRQVAPVAKVAGLSIEETSAYLGELFNIGLRGEQAGTSLRNVIVRLVRPVGEAKGILEELGIATLDATGNFRSLELVLQDLADANLSEARLAQIFENEALAGAVRLLKVVRKEAGQTQSAYRKLLDEITGTDRALELTLENLDTLGGSMNLARNAMTELGIEVGSALAPAIRTISTIVLEAVTAFRSLDEGTKETIATMAALAASGIASLAVINALSLVLGGPLTKALKGIGVGFAAASVKAGVFSKLMLGMRGVFQGITNGLGLMLIGLGNLIPALRGVTTAAFMFLPGGPLVGGILAITAALGAGALAWKAYGNAMDVTPDEAASQLAAKNFADGLISEAAIEEVRYKAQRLREGIDSISSFFSTSPLDRAVSFSNFGEGAKRLGEAIDEDIVGAQGEYDAIVAKLKTFNSPGGGNAYDILSQQITNEEDIIANLSRRFEDDSGTNYADLLAAAQTNIDGQLANQAELFSIAEAGQQKEQAAVLNFLVGFAEGNVQLGDQYLSVADSLRDLLNAEAGLAVTLSQEIAAGDETSLASIVEKLIRATGIPEEAVQGILDELRPQVLSKLVGSLAGAQADQAIEIEKLKIALLEGQADQAEGLTEALRLAQQAGSLQLIRDLSDLADDAEADILEAFGKIGFEDVAAIQIIMARAAATFEGDLDVPAEFEDILGGALVTRKLIEARNANVDITNDALQELANAEIILNHERVKALVDAALKGGLSEEQAAQLAAFWEGQADLIQGNIELGIIAAQDDVESRTKSFVKSGAAAGKAARDAIKDARALEDAFIELGDASLGARQTLNEYLQGLSVDERITIDLDLDIQSIVRDYDAQLLALARELEDLQVEFKGQPAVLEELRVKYGQVVEEIENARAAELAYTNTFTAQMERRSEALDLFIRDLENVAAVSENTFDKVKAGVQQAMAEFSKELVTITSITKNTVTELTGAFTSLLGDMIFDSKNALENFKASMLEISRAVFEQFTTGLIQQLVDGFATEQQAFGGNGVGASEGGGGGGLLGGLFDGIQSMLGFGGGGGGEQGGGAQAAGVPSGGGGGGANPLAKQIEALQKAVNEFTQNFSTLMQDFTVNITQTLNDFGTQFAQALSQAIQAVQQAGGIGGGLGGLGGVTYTPIGAPTATGGLGGASGGITGGGGISGIIGGLFQSLLGSIFSFADGGSVAGPGGPTDDKVLSWLSNGEFVVNAAVTKTMLPFLEAINGGKPAAAAVMDMVGTAGLQSIVNNYTNETGGLPAYATGGLVGGSFDSPLITSLGNYTQGLSAPPSTPANKASSLSRGDTHVTVHMTVNATDAGSFARSEDQIAKRLGAKLKRASSLN